MKEELISFLWQYKKFNFLDLQSTDNQAIEIIEFGTKNPNAGPDFINAKVKIDNTTWMGSVELHVYSSQWISHKHQENIAYDNVILHVVWEDDKPILRSNGVPIPCLELRNITDIDVIDRYHNLQSSSTWIPCQNSIGKVPSITTTIWLQTLVVERMLDKAKNIDAFQVKYDHHWEMLFFIAVARAMGLKVNSQAFEALASSIPIEVLQKHRDQPIQIEALLFGQANLLASSYSDKYPKKLLTEYTFLKTKYSLESIPKNYWKFMRMRPFNFPTIRLAQLANLISDGGLSFQSIIDTPVQGILHLFENINPSTYWKDHYLFDKASEAKAKPMGKDRRDLILINAVSPLLTLYAQHISDDTLLEKATDILNMLPAEKNVIIDHWKELGIKANNASESQGLIHLKNHYCTHFRCLNCSIGLKIMSK